MLPDNGIHIHQTDSMAGASSFPGDYPVVFYQHRLFYRIVYGKNQLAFFKGHFKTDYPVGIKLFAGGNGIVQQIAQQYDNFFLADGKRG